MAKSVIYPTVIDLKPPTKEMIICPNVGKGIDLWIFHAEHPEGTEVGQKIEGNDFSNLKGLACWLKFTDADAMEKFGTDIVRFARQRKKRQKKNN